MDPADEIRNSKKQKEYIDMLTYVNDSQYGIPRKCPCGGSIINEVSRKEENDAVPGKRLFTCKNYEADGLHYRQPWVIGVQEEIERLTKRVVEAEEVMLETSKLSREMERLEEKVQSLCEQVDYLTVHVGRLEKVCFD
ncbi:hypothetical protein Bca4012_019730 [Brassica carinata]